MRHENEKIILSELHENLRKLMVVPSYQVGDYTFDVEKRTLTIGSESVKLTRKESYLFVLFAANINNFLEREIRWLPLTPSHNHWSRKPAPQLLPPKRPSTSTVHPRRCAFGPVAKTAQSARCASTVALRGTWQKSVA